MESATIAGNGFRFRVPYGTLLCVSDKPVHGQLKLKARVLHTTHKRVVAMHLPSILLGMHGDVQFQLASRSRVYRLVCAPNLTVFCVQGMANEFYNRRTAEHLRMGLEAVRTLQAAGARRLHSRKLRGFDEPPFR
jgi:AMP nucleosidase